MTTIAHFVFTVSGAGCLDDGFHETGIDEASKHGTGSMLVDSSFQKI